MNLADFIEHFEAFITYVEEAWEQKDLEILKAIVSDCEDFINAHGYQFKCYSMDSKSWKELYKKNREKRKEIADGICEWCAKAKGTATHHLCHRGKLSLYNDVRLLRLVCVKCHRLIDPK